MQTRSENLSYAGCCLETARSLWSRSLAVWALIFCVLIVCAPHAYADALQSQANQRNLLPGGRAALMGGAFSAVADDATAGYYNPAGLVFGSASRLEVSGSAFRTAKVTYEDTINGEPFEERAASVYPSFMGGAVQLGRWALGYSFLTLDTRSVYQQNDFQGIASVDGTAQSYARTYQESSLYSWSGGSIAFKLANNWSLGFSAFYYERRIEFSTHEFFELNGGGFRVIDDTLRTFNVGTAYTYGLFYKGSQWALGLSAKTSRAISNHSSISIDTLSYDPTLTGATPEVDRLTNDYPSLHELNPSTYGLGLAWRPSSWFLLSADGLLHIGVKTPYADEGGEDLHTTPNYSLGMEVNMGSLAVMAGAFTNNSLFRAPDSQLSDQPTHIDYRGFSGGLGWDIKGFYGQVGVVRQLGSGEAQLRRNTTSIQEVQAEATTYLVSGKIPL